MKRENEPRTVQRKEATEASHDAVSLSPAAPPSPSHVSSRPSLGAEPRDVENARSVPVRALYVGAGPPCARKKERTDPHSPAAQVVWVVHSPHGRHSRPRRSRARRPGARTSGWRRRAARSPRRTAAQAASGCPRRCHQQAPGACGRVLRERRAPHPVALLGAAASRPVSLRGLAGAAEGGGGRGGRLQRLPPGRPELLDLQHQQGP